MSESAVASEAQNALVKMLMKLHLIDEKRGAIVFSSQDLCPIAFFARESCYEEDHAIKLVAETLRLPQIVLDKGLIATCDLLMDHPGLRDISVTRWRALRALPIELQDRTLLLAMANPLDQVNVKSLKMELGLEVTQAVMREDQILAALAAKDGTSGETVDLQSVIEKIETNANPNKIAQPASTTDSSVADDDPSAPPVIRLVNKLLSDAVAARASDIHILPEKDLLSIKVRVDGLMQPLFSVPAKIKNSVISRLKLLGGMDISERRKPQDGRLRIESKGETKDLRLSSAPTLYGENLVIRILSSDVGKISLESLGVEDKLREQFDRSLAGSSRVFLVTGPTGSGKTSTLYGCLLRHNKGLKNIITIEDPVEYRVKGITQIQVNHKIGVTFAEGLRSILRQDPDVIMVGEIRDPETCSIAMQAAQTGHLVLSTLHTNSAPGAITRLRELGIPSYLIASALGSIVAQRLVRKLCPHCAVPYEGPDLSYLRSLGLNPRDMKSAAGCEKCGKSGYIGRTAIYSFLEVTESVHEAIFREMSEKEIEARARPSGYKSLFEAAIELLSNGVTSQDEVERALGSLDSYAKGRSEPKPQPAPRPPTVQTVPDETAQDYQRLEDPVKEDSRTVFKRKEIVIREPAAPVVVPPPPPPPPAPAQTAPTPAPAPAIQPTPAPAATSPIERDSPGSETKPAPETKLTSAPSASEPQKSLSKRKALVVDDNEKTRKLICMLLKKYMFEVEQACDGQEALEKVYTFRPDIIISDLQMPRMNGEELVKRLNRDAQLRQIPVLILTANDVEQYEIAAIESGARDFVSKTASPKVLMARIYRILNV